MSAKYLLPCACGQNVVIGTRQAGESVACACGAALTAPSMLEISRLEPAVDDTVGAAGTSWGPRQQLMLVGGVVLFLAVVGAGWLVAHRPVSPFDQYSVEDVQKGYQDLSPWQSWTIWKRMEVGFDRRPDKVYEEERAQFHIWLIFTGVVAGAGIAIVVVGATMAAHKRRPPRGRRGAPQPS